MGCKVALFCKKVKKLIICFRLLDIGKTNGFGLDLTANGHTFTIDGQALPYSVGANETLVLHCNENDDFIIVAKTPNA